ncbi:MAG: SDR family oxidoreductase [Microbacteriaceae bacterium]
MAGELALVTGATGYVGGRLVPRLLEAGYRVRVIVRSPQKLTDVPWAGDVEIVQGDLQDADAVAAASVDVDIIYYLVHSLAATGDFEQLEIDAATNIATAAAVAEVSRIVYLGGLHPDSKKLSRHLRSRAAVGQILLESGVPTAALQAGVIIGSGSASFEMIRHLTDVLPYMPAPRWVRNKVQPIAIRDVLYYLVAAASLPASVNRSFDIGGPDVLRYGQMMNGYAVEAGLAQRPIAALPVLTPWLASQWVNLVTPIPRRLAVPIIESLQYDCVVREREIDNYIPRPAEGLVGYRRAVRLALAKMRDADVETTWQNASVHGAPSDPLPSDPDWSGHAVYTDLRERDTTASVGELWGVIEGIGGRNGWYSFPLAWALRGWIDKLFGGVGLRRGRRHADQLYTGEALDFWRVEQLERGRALRLRAEMRMPGRAWLELETSETPTGAHYRQRAVFFPQGLAGRLYWFGILPFHGIIFNGMANRIIAEAELRAGKHAAVPSGAPSGGATPVDGQPAAEQRASVTG